MLYTVDKCIYFYYFIYLSILYFIYEHFALQRKQAANHRAA